MRTAGPNVGCILSVLIFFGLVCWPLRTQRSRRVTPFRLTDGPLIDSCHSVNQKLSWSLIWCFMYTLGGEWRMGRSAGADIRRGSTNDRRELICAHGCPALSPVTERDVKQRVGKHRNGGRRWWADALSREEIPLLIWIVTTTQRSNPRSRFIRAIRRADRSRLRESHSRTSRIGQV